MAVLKMKKLRLIVHRKKSEELLRSHPDIPADTPIVFYSSLKGEGRADLWKLIADYTGLKL